MLFLIFVVFSHISTAHEAHFHAIQQILTPWRPASFVSEHGGTGIDGRGVCGTSQFFLDPLQNDQISTSSICFKMYAGFMWFYDILCQWIWYGLACIKAHHFFVADSVLQRFQCVVMDYPDEGLCIHELNPQLWGLWSLPFLYSSADDFWTEEDPTSPDFHVIWWCGDAKCSDWEKVGTDSSPSWPRSIPRILGYHQASGWRCDARCAIFIRVFLVSLTTPMHESQWLVSLQQGHDISWSQGQFHDS